jgi:hypothetical protein
VLAEAKLFSIGAEDNAIDSFPMALEREDREYLIAGPLLVGSPYLYRSVGTRRGQPPIRAEGHCLDRARLALQGAHLPAGGHVPNLYRLVIAGRRQPSAVRAEGYALDGFGVALQYYQLGMVQIVPVMPFEAAQVRAAGVFGALAIQQLKEPLDMVVLPGLPNQTQIGDV